MLHVQASLRAVWLHSIIGVIFHVVRVLWNRLIDSRFLDSILGARVDRLLRRACPEFRECDDIASHIVGHVSKRIKHSAQGFLRFGSLKSFWRQREALSRVSTM